MAFGSLRGWGRIRNNIIFTINNVHKKRDFVYIPSVCKKHDFV